MDLPSAFRAPSPGSPSSAPTLLSSQHRSYSLPSISSASSPSDRHSSLSPLSPCDRDRAGAHRPKLQLPPMLPMLPLPSPQLKHQTTDPHDHQADSNKKQRQLSFSSSTCSSPRLASLSSPALSSSLSPSLSRQQRHHPYSTYSYYPPTPSSSSPRVMYQQQQQHSHSSQDQDRSSQYYHNLPSSGSDYFQPRFPYHHSQPFATPQEEEREPTVILPHLRTPSSSHSDLHSLYHHHGHNSTVAPKLEEHEMGLSTFLRSMKTLSSPYTCSSPSTPMSSSSSRDRSHHRHENDMEVEDDEAEEEMESDEEDERSSQSSSSRSRSTSLAFGNMSEASASMTSLTSASSYSSSSPSPTPVPSTTTTTSQLLMCPVCSRAFKPSKNQNCNLRRHLKNVHNMSPTMHPRKCKWDSLPDGRVKDDKDRKERTRKSKRIWAQKFRQRRKVEEAAVVLSMLSQAV
ncbi:hypothetical protein EMPS_04644 [Entomortierella parvispora]|uniref:Uncharacterized protein n=1 Tax=Entomortierella parvispora TaxID=205924 RepID=A0A9P3H9L9_9FUNG|nr:hypothetical protein EMPS_04644 [Entomortierella parvispora]